MNDENLHITPDPHKGVPKPEISADEAWKNMAGMLDAEMPVSPPDSASPQKPPSSGGSGIFGGSIHFWTLGLIVMGVAGIVTWGVMHQSNKPETSVVKEDTINTIQHNTVTGSLTTANQNEPLLKGNIKSPSTKAAHGTNMDQHGMNPDKKITFQSTAISKPANIARPEQPQTLTAASISMQSEGKTKVVVPSQTITDSVITTAGITPQQNQVTDEKLQDSVKLAEAQPVKASGFAESGKPNNTGPEKPTTSPGMPGNLSWQLGVSGNLGEVVQKGRNPNLYYGAMVTGGLFHKKLKAGIETGIGWAVYNDYGSVSDNLRITDSITGDTLHPVTYTDTTRIFSSTYRYQYLQIPLFLSKQIVRKGKFEFGIKTGPVVGFLISNKQVSSSNSGPDNGEILSTVNSDYSRLSISWQWNLMLELRWNFNDRLSFTLSPSGIYYLNNLYNSNNKPANIPFGIGVNAGLIYRFK